MAVRSYHIISFHLFPGAGFSPSTGSSGQSSQNSVTQRVVPSYWATSDLYVRGFLVVESGNVPGSTPFRLRRNGSSTILDSDTVNVNATGFGNMFTFNLQSLGVWAAGDYFTIGWSPTVEDQVWIVRLLASDNASFT